MPAVTIVIPVLNRASYLPQLFHSLAAVSYEEMEVVLVDNGSTDGSLMMCRSFAEEAPFVVTVLAEPRRGACCARNAGLRYCKTEWVYFFDSDDEISPSFLVELMPQVREGIDVVAFPTMQELGGSIAQRAFCPSPSAATQILSLTLNTQSMIFRTRFLREIGGWDESLAIWQDWELGTRLLLLGATVAWHGQQAYHVIHVHSDSITGPSFSARQREIQHTLEVVAAELKTRRERNALFLRCSIANGLLRREGRRRLSSPVEVGPLCRLAGKLLEGYTALGGRGAWRLALCCC